MSAVPVFIRRYPITAFYILTFAVSWGGIILMMGPEGIPSTREKFEKVLPGAIAAMLAGPCTAGMLLTILLDGRQGLRDLFSRMLAWRVAGSWYALALLFAPALIIALFLALSVFSPAFLPGLFTTADKTSRLMFGICAALAVGFLEELGWTGFAIPRLRRQYSILSTGLIVGVLWGAWHIMGQVILASGTYTGGLPPRVFLVERTLSLLIGSLPAFRVLMVLVYDRTGSLFVAMVMHFSLTASTLIFEPVNIAGMNLLIYDALSVVAWWAVVAAVLVAAGKGRVTIFQRSLNKK